MTIIPQLFNELFDTVRWKGRNMYPFISKTWNPLKGMCLHKCPYCYVPHSRVAKLYTGAPRLDERSLNQNLGTGGFVFVSNMNDLFGKWVASEWIEAILGRCGNYDNWYLFQSKNPKRFLDVAVYLPPKTILATTLECINPNDDKKLRRMTDFSKISCHLPAIHMVTIEPIMDFDVTLMIVALTVMNPHVVTIGADSKGHNLPEPSAEKVLQLIEWIQSQGIKIVSKHNLDRLLKPKGKEKK